MQLVTAGETTLHLKNATRSAGLRFLGTRRVGVVGGIQGNLTSIFLANVTLVRNQIYPSEIKIRVSEAEYNRSVSNSHATNSKLKYT